MKSRVSRSLAAAVILSTALTLTSTNASAAPSPRVRGSISDGVGVCYVELVFSGFSPNTFYSYRITSSNTTNVNLDFQADAKGKFVLDSTLIAGFFASNDGTVDIDVAPLNDYQWANLIIENYEPRNRCIANN